jgi:hypothetical protein
MIKTLVEIYFKDPARQRELYDGVHQILMTGEYSISFSHGTRFDSIPYGDIDEIKVRFIEEQPMTSSAQPVQDPVQSTNGNTSHPAPGDQQSDNGK